MANNTSHAGYGLGQLCWRARFGLAALLCSILISSCGKSAPLLNPDPLAPFIEARYRVEGAVATFKQEFQPVNQTDRLSESDWNQYRQGRQLYSRAASSINALIVQVMLANQTRTEIPEAQFKQQMEQAIKQAIEFQTYAESVRRTTPTGSSSAAMAPLTIPINPIAIPSLIDSTFGQISNALQRSRQAQQDKRDRLEAVLRSLLLPSFDEAGRVPDGTPTPPRIQFQPPSRPLP